MWLALIVSLFTNLLFFGANVYKYRLINEMQAKQLLFYEDAAKDCNELKGCLNFDERASRELNIKKKLNEMDCKYSKYLKKNKNNDFEELIEEACKKYVKKELNTTAGNENV